MPGKWSRLSGLTKVSSQSSDCDRHRVRFNAEFLQVKSLPRTVVVLGWVSFFTDVSSEMIYPLLPLFLSTVLGASVMQLGLIEGFAESTSSLLKVVSGVWTDRAQFRKPFIVFGYGLAGLVRPLIGLAGGWSTVFGLRFLDRVGKGVRSSPRDALIADVTAKENRGAAYGFHNSMDHAGAMLGPLVAGALLKFMGLPLRQVFLWAGVPAVIAWLVLVLGIREKARGANPGPVPEAFHFLRDWNLLGRDFKCFLLAMFVFTLGNSTDAFLLIRLSQAGISAGMIAMLWSALHFVKMTSTYYGGKTTDRVGRRVMVVSGWAFYALIYLGFGLVHSPGVLIALFLTYGIYFGLSEPAEKAWIADLVPANLRGTAFGYFQSGVGLAALPASVIFGMIWQKWGVSAAFVTGATLAAVASLLLFFIKEDHPDPVIV